MARKLTQVLLLTATLAAPLALAACANNNEAEGPATDTTTVVPMTPAPMDTTMMDTTMTDTTMADTMAM